MFPAQSLMGISSALSIAFEGLRANFWGLGCPAYCTQPSVGLVLCSYLLGLLSGWFPSFWPSGVSVFPLRLVRVDPKSLLLTCISRSLSTDHDGEIKLHIQLPGRLSVDIRAPAHSSGLAADLLRHIALFEPGPFPDRSEASFELKVGV